MCVCLLFKDEDKIHSPWASLVKTIFFLFNLLVRVEALWGMTFPLYLAHCSYHHNLKCFQLLLYKTLFQNICTIHWKYVHLGIHLFHIACLALWWWWIRECIGLYLVTHSPKGSSDSQATLIFVISWCKITAIP